MKTLVVYDSVFGNTEKVARALASGMLERGIKINCVRANGRDWDAWQLRYDRYWRAYT